MSISCRLVHKMTPSNRSLEGYVSGVIYRERPEYSRKKEKRTLFGCRFRNLNKSEKFIKIPQTVFNKKKEPQE